jgi:uracil-DNA glycosylase
MIAVEEMRGPGFFPGCTGTIDSKQDIKRIPFMVLGQDFDTAANHQLIDKVKGGIDTNMTWRNLRKLLRELQIDELKCFFTNAYMGLRPDTRGNGKTKNTGKCPAAKKGADSFTKGCQEFFKKQLAIMQPEVVLVLGKETAKFVSKVFPEKCSKWATIQTFKSFYADADNISIVFDFQGKKINFLFVIHPSLNNTNRSIIWGKEEGKWKEQELLRKYLN